MKREAESEHQRDTAIRQSGDGAQQPAEWNQEDEIREYPQMLRGKRRQARERPHHERGKWRDWHQSDGITLNGAVVLFTLKPYPFVLARGVEPLMHQPRGRIVVREIGVQPHPGVRHGMREQISNEQQ
jgi:hypothetical protein